MVRVARGLPGGEAACLCAADRPPAAVCPLCLPDTACSLSTLNGARPSHLSSCLQGRGKVDPRQTVWRGALPGAPAGLQRRKPRGRRQDAASAAGAGLGERRRVAVLSLCSRQCLPREPMGRDRWTDESPGRAAAPHTVQAKGDLPQDECADENAMCPGWAEDGEVRAGRDGGGGRLRCGQQRPALQPLTVTAPHLPPARTLPCSATPTRASCMRRAASPARSAARTATCCASAFASAASTRCSRCRCQTSCPSRTPSLPLPHA